MEDKNIQTKCCSNCTHYDIRTHFCRLNPPSPVVFFDFIAKENKVSSKYPIITIPDLDYCDVGFISKT